MTNQNDIEINDEELEEDSEFITAGQLAEYVDQEFVEDEIVSYHIYSKSDVESDLGVEITEVHNIVKFNQKPWLKTYIDFKSLVTSANFEPLRLELADNTGVGVTNRSLST
jgi:hypothetical protein